uniref:Bile acid:sodium symporter n=1 Tax=Opuntia streptacantha TaxID=393608 RepID=A0A7C9A330_OPUST
MTTSSASLPFVFLSPKSQLPCINSPLKFTPLSLRFNRKAKHASKVSGHLSRVEAAGDYGGFLGNHGGSMCSTTPFIGLGGRVGLQRREGNVSLLSFGVHTNQISGDDSKSDSSQVLSAMLPFVVAATAIAALSQPSTFTWVSKELYAPALGGIMLSIGIRLSISDFALVFQRPLPLSIGFIAQYVLKPVLGVMIAQAFGMPPMFYAGFVLTACVAGAQLSSYASFLSKADVALSILLTSSSTIASVIVTPLLTRLLIGSVVPVDAVAMSKSILQVVLVPVSLGLLLNTYAKPVVNLVQPVMPFVAMFCTSLCIGSPLAINRGHILSAEGLRLIAPVLTFHAAAFIIGYWFSKLLMPGQEEEVCRTISLCTGMQSSTLAGLLATQFLGSTQAVPPACSVVVMAIMGLTLASFWGSGLKIRDLPRHIVPCFGSTVKAS